MSSEALERADEMIAALLAEVARLEQAHKRDAETWGGVMQERNEARAALAVAREREQRAVRALDDEVKALKEEWKRLLDEADRSDGEGAHVGFPMRYRNVASGVAFALERLRVARAALVDEPAAASGSASAAADEPGETP